jgi:RHS repeat-associated protein
VNTFQYDNFCNLTNRYDINYGRGGRGNTTYTYTYDAYDQPITQTDPNGNNYGTTIHPITYDLLGRLTSKYSTLEGGYYTYTYVGSGNGLNMLHEEQAPNGNSVIYTYDNLRRPVIINENGLNTSFIYDAYSNVEAKTYPGGFSIVNTYNSSGYLTQTNQATIIGNVITPGALIWQAIYMDPLGNYFDYYLGNGAETQKSYTPYGYLNSILASGIQNMTFDFDPTNGNLSSRSTNGTLAEYFSYDNYPNSRLTEAQTTYPTPSTTTADIQVIYDANGNILNKSDICLPTYNYSNGNTNNQVTQVPNNSFNAITPPQSITYTSFNKPVSIQGGAGNAYNLSFTYGAEDSRISTTLNDATTGNTTTRTYAQDYESTVVTGSNPAAVQVSYINCGGDLVAMYVNQPSIPSASLYYVYTDHLGSILTLTDPSASIVAQQSFDAWGNYRNPTDGTNNSLPAVPFWLYRGFTGHEHLPEFQLINMNGRMYDPLISSMLNADPDIQDTKNTQNYNRYSYALNNPLKYTDLTGDDWVKVNDGTGYAGYIWNANSSSGSATAYWTNKNGQAMYGDPSGNLWLIKNGVNILAQSAPIVANSNQSIKYGGDGSGSFMDYMYQINFALNQFNPIAYGLNFLDGYFHGRDMYGNKQSSFETGLNLAFVFMPIGGEGAVEKALVNEAKYTVYMGYDEAGNARYIGMTGRDIAIRATEHKNSGTERALLEFEAYAQNLTKREARILEQTLINARGGVSSDQLLNIRNSIAPQYWESLGIKKP